MGGGHRSLAGLPEPMNRPERDRTQDIRTLSVAMTDDHTRALARRAVARWASGVEDARMLMDMLDLRPRPGEER